MPPSSPELRRQLPQPCEELHSSGGPIGCMRHFRADLDRNAISGIDQNKGILIGHVIPGKHRSPAREWLLVEEIGDGGPLAASNCLYLHNHFAALNLGFPQFADN